MSHPPDRETTFVPMPSVDGIQGIIAQPEIKPFAQVARGYTYFENRDVLFAKITPCMQNGKHAIAGELLGGFAFGSTEFHIIRAGAAITPEWIHTFIRQAPVLEEAQHHFRGAVGQQRVPQDFLDHLPIPLPPLAEQRRIVAELERKNAVAARLEQAARQQLADLAAMPAALLREGFAGAV